MPCRDSAVVGITQAIARDRQSADDVQTLSMFAELRRSGEAQVQATPSRAEWHSFLDDTSTRATGRFTGPRQARYERILRDARTAEDLPDGKTFYAMKNISTRVERSHAAVDNALRGIAEQHEVSQASVRAAYKRLINENRSIRRADSPPSAEENLGVSAAHLPGDRATRWSLSMLHYGGAQVIEARSPLNPEIASAITSRARSASQRCPQCGEFIGRGAHICHEGVTEEPRTGLPTAPASQVAPEPTPESSPPVPEAVPAPEPAAAAPVVEAAEEPAPAVGPGMAEPVPVDTGGRRSNARRYRNSYGSMLRTTNRSTLLRTARENAEQYVRTPYATGVPNPAGGAFWVSGAIDVRDTLEAGRRWSSTRTGDRYEAQVADQRLRCSCTEYRQNYDCPHVRQAVEEYAAWLNEREPTPAVAPEAAAANVTASLDADARAAERATMTDQMLHDANADGVEYSDMAQFQSDWDEIRARVSAGDTAMSYTTENATGGLSSRENGRAFGIEIEIDFPDDAPDASGSYQARRRYAAALHEAGISQWDVPLGWQPFRERGVGVVGGGHTDEPTRWSVQHDSSVDGLNGRRGAEIVSPILYDEPHTWENIQQVLDIAKEHGGQVTVKTGLHVNISGSDFNHTLENYNNLLGMVDKFEDPLIRCATNPYRTDTTWHRGRAYCTPVTAPAQGFRTIRDAVAHHDHHAMLSLASMPSEGQSVNRGTRVEFRQFDGTLDAGRLQAHVKMSLAMMSAAKRGVNGSDMTAEPAGTHRNGNLNPQTGRMPRLSGSQWEDDTRSFRRLADSLFSRGEDKKQFLELFASSRWQRGMD